MKIYFTDFFNISEDTLDKYGAFNVSLINDLPLFIDPFLLFGNKKTAPTTKDLVRRTQKTYKGALAVGEDLLTIEIGDRVNVVKYHSSGSKPTQGLK